MTEINIEELANQVVQPYGRSFIPAWFNPNEEGNFIRNNSMWAGQQIFCLDFDGGISLQEVIERCDKYNITPAFAYTTFSSVDNNKFRVVFRLLFEVTDIRIRNVVQYALIGLFPECDKSCKDAARLFYGGKEIIFSNYNATIDIIGLIESMITYIYLKDPAHAKRFINNYCRQCGLQMVNGFPHCERQCVEFSNNGEANAHAIIYKYSTCAGLTKNEGSLSPTKGEINRIYFCNEDVEDAIRNIKKKIPGFKVEDTKNKRDYIRRYEFSNLSDNCRLFRDFDDGLQHLSHNERFGIATNLLMIEGGATRFSSGIEARGEYNVAKWTCICKYIIGMDYKPSRCENFCPYHKECNHAENMIQQGKLNKGFIQVIGNPVYKPLSQAETELKDAMDKALKVKDNKIYVIKAPPGIGKSELYLYLQNATIAVPTHKLKHEIAYRMRRIGNNFVTTPDLPELHEHYLNRLIGYYKVGAYSSAGIYIKYLAEKEKLEGAAKYLSELETAQNSDQTMITTHERLLYLRDNNELTIVDEDIVPTLLKQGYVSIDDLRYLFSLTTKEPFGKFIESIVDFADNASLDIITHMPSVISVPEQLDYIVAKSNRISSNVLGFLKCSHFIKRKVYGKDIVYFINKQNLPLKKTIILSATADEWIYKHIFGERLMFIDLGLVENKGTLVQYPERSYSRYQLKKNKEKLKGVVDSVVGKIPKITYKNFMAEFDNAVSNFGATFGIDEFGGKDLAIIGTPHFNPIVYALYAAALGIEINMTDFNTMSYTTVERNGFRFNFTTYSDNESLKKIQFYIIETELIQAIGRARLLRNDCTVTVSLIIHFKEHNSNILKMNSCKHHELEYNPLKIRLKLSLIFKSNRRW